MIEDRIEIEEEGKKKNEQGRDVGGHGGARRPPTRGTTARPPSSDASARHTETPSRFAEKRWSRTTKWKAAAGVAAKASPAKYIEAPSRSFADDVAAGGTVPLVSDGV